MSTRRRSAMAYASHGVCGRPHASRRRARWCLWVACAFSVCSTLPTCLRYPVADRVLPAVVPTGTRL